MARFKFALAGLITAWQQETSLRTEAGVFACVVAYMLWRQPPVFWWVAILLAAALAFVAELMNTAIENVCDAVHPSQHPGIGAAKDCASAAVLVANLMGLGLFIGMVISLWR